MINQANRVFAAVHDQLRRGDFDGAIKEVFDKKSRKINAPYSSFLNQAWYVIGDANYRGENFREAISAFKKSFQHGKGDIEPLVAIANCYSEARKPRYTIHYLSRAIDLAGQDARLLYNLGNAYFDLRKYDEANKLFAKVAKTSGRISLLAKKNIHAIKVRKNRIARA